MRPSREKTVVAGILDGIFGGDEPQTALGKGVTVVRLQVALEAKDRGSSSILQDLAVKANAAVTSSSRGLARLVSETCLSLLRRSDDWVAACSEVKTFRGGSGPDEAEIFFNRMVTKEVAKFDKEYVPEPGSPQEGAVGTLVVVSVLLAIRGDRTTFQSINGNEVALRDALQLIVGDVMAEDGNLVIAAELLWTPSEPDEVLDKRQLVLDYPELVDL